MTDQVEKFDVFISYSSVDVEFANTVAHELDNRDLKCWIAPRNIPLGSDYSEAIINGIEKSDSLLVLLSENSLASKHVRAEVAKAINLDKVVIPVRIVDVEIAGGIQFFLELRQSFDLFPSFRKSLRRTEQKDQIWYS